MWCVTSLKLVQCLYKVVCLFSVECIFVGSVYGKATFLQIEYQLYSHNSKHKQNYGDEYPTRPQMSATYHYQFM